VLRLTLVQEQVFWFDQLVPPVQADIAIDVSDADHSSPRSFPQGPPKFDLEQASRWTAGLIVRRNHSFSNLGFCSHPHPAMLAFVESPRFADQISRIAEVVCVLTTPQLAESIATHLGLAISETPRMSFIEIHNYLANRTNFYWDDFQTVIDPSADIHPTAHIPEFNVVIGPNVVIEPNVTIHERTIVGERCVVHSGAVLGGEGFQTNRAGGRLCDMVHAGVLRVEADSKIFANAVVARGVFRESTRIGPDARVGNAAFISHNVGVGARAFVGHGAVVNGYGQISDDAWVGPGATIASGILIGRGAHVSLGATVIRDIEPHERVIGSVAAQSRKMLRFMKQFEKRGKGRSAQAAG
jgi:UDP-3-O-[3-hydroxymyristoyl] glucosamine N-acyltransferase